MAYPLTVALNGVCVHLGESSEVPLPAAHRVVFPAGDTLINGTPISGHAPVISVSGASEMALPQQALSSATVTFASFSAAAAPFSGTMRCLPKLRSSFPWFQLARDKVTTGAGLPGGAFVDFDSGVISMVAIGGAACTEVVIDYDFPAAAMVITPWNGEAPQVIPIPLPARVTIENDSTNHDVQDFGLVFLLAEEQGMPSDITLEDEMNAVIASLRACLDEQEGDIGCSNSQFP